MAKERIVRAGGRHEILTVLGFLVIGGLILYVAWLGPKWRRAAAQESLMEAAAAYDRRDCATAAAHIADALRKLGDTLTTEHQRIERRCAALLDAPAGGVARFLARTTEAVCAGQPPNVTDDMGNRYGREFFMLIDSAAAGVWGDAAVDAFLPEDGRATRVNAFGYAVCREVVQSRPLERCAYTLFRGGAQQNVYLTRATQDWRIRIVAARTGREIAARRFTTAAPGTCQESEAALNRGDVVVTGPPDTTRLAEWLGEVIP